MEVSDQFHAPAALLLVTHWLGDWVSRRFGLDSVVMRKITALSGKRAPVIQSVAQSLH